VRNGPRRFPPGVILNRTQARQAVRLLGELQSLLESGIQALLVDGKDPDDTPQQMELRQLRAQRKDAEDLVKAIESKLPPLRGEQ